MTYLTKAILMIMGLYLVGCMESQDKKVERLFQPYIGQNKPGAAVLVIKDGKSLFARTYGQANLDQKIPVTAKTNFRLASVTKQFTAACILQLIEQDKLSLDRTLSDIYEKFPEYGKNISIKNVLQHTSGMLAYEDLIPDTVAVQVTDADVLKLMMEQDSTYFEPGSTYRYSNSGYAVLAMIVEKISGKTFARYLDENIFKSLGMDSTVAYQKEISTVPNRAMGYDVTDSVIEDSDQSAYSAVLGDGGIYSNLEDLMKWDAALYTEKILSKESLQAAFSPFKENYGFGWRIDKYKGHLRTHHTGSTSGFRNVIRRFPDDKFTVIILSNRKEPGVGPLADALVDMYLLGE